MSNLPVAFGRGNMPQGAYGNASLAEEIMRATMDMSASTSDTDETSFETRYHSEVDASETEESIITTTTTDTEPKRFLLPSDQPLVPFVPARLKKGERATITPEIQALLTAAGVQPNPKYEGEITAEVLNDLTTPDDQNCALHITCIHSKAEMKDLFPTIHHGKVYSVAWNHPNNEWAHGAARLCFCKREAAEKYLEESETGDGITIFGQRITVEWNRNKKCPVPEDEDHQSRVVQLRGPRSFGFSAQDLEDFFGKDMKLHIISRREWDHKLDQKVVELAFCGIRAQSRMAFRCFKQKVAAQGLGDQFDIRFAPDLCDPNADQGKDMFMPRSRTPRNLEPVAPASASTPRTLESIRTSSWRTGANVGPAKNVNGKGAARSGAKYDKGTGPNAASWRRAY